MACRIKAKVVRKRSGVGRKTEPVKGVIERGRTEVVNSQLITVAKAGNGDGGTEAVCVRLGCVFVRRGKETAVLLSPEQAASRLSQFPLANNNSPQVRIEARLKTRTHPAQNEGV